MTLAGILAHNESELVCDLAEYYHIYDYRSVPAKLLGTLTVGLRDESRIGMLRRREKASPEVMMLARIYDMLTLIFSKKGADIKSLAKQLTIVTNESDYRSFATSDEFKHKWSDINRR